MNSPLITVVGGANTDIVGFPTGRYISRDSNPGHVRTSPGGVGRNIAENLARLGARVRLVTAFGDDETGQRLRAECEAVGMDVSYSVTVAGTPGSCYLALLDERGDLAGAVNDMRALDALGPELLDPEAFASADAVVVDTNLQASTIAQAVDLSGAAPVVLDPVSTAKSLAARPVLGRLGAIKANRREAEEISGAAGAAGAADRLLEAGIRWVFVSEGPEGVLCASAEERFRMPPPGVRVVNATGAGDAFTAGVAFGAATRRGLAETARLASALAGFALESERTVSDAITLDGVLARAEAMRG
jgi:pseudouridine kinase